jgi:hypothetical protein
MSITSHHVYLRGDVVASTDSRGGRADAIRGTVDRAL